MQTRWASSTSNSRGSTRSGVGNATPQREKPRQKPLSALRGLSSMVASVRFPATSHPSVPGATKFDDNTHKPQKGGRNKRLLLFFTRRVILQSLSFCPTITAGQPQCSVLQLANPLTLLFEPAFIFPTYTCTRLCSHSFTNKSAGSRLAYTTFTPLPGLFLTLPNLDHQPQPQQSLKSAFDYHYELTIRKDTTPIYATRHYRPTKPGLDTYTFLHRRSVTDCFTSTPYLESGYYLFAPDLQPSGQPLDRSHARGAPNHVSD
ncbi:hypothetical protein DL546_003005 [Coniochaeta pulveracea]|uniref:Uncharacterized protein n=1 Tax=Coniochaeta pulveracea TaxID=177199 RepID=A0A420Y1H1_9PEZI|nr:hypothetical protein DL546_003005 [Coniochaeta pulveracea]